MEYHSSVPRDEALIEPTVLSTRENITEFKTVVTGGQTHIRLFHLCNMSTIGSPQGQEVNLGFQNPAKED